MKNVCLIVFPALVTSMILSSCGGNTSDKEILSNKESSSNIDSLPNDESSSNEVAIGKQVWMTKNLNVDKFRNGDPIPEAKTDEEWESAGGNYTSGGIGQPVWCYYNNNPDNGDSYGKLYNWHAVNDPRGLAPEGWKIPSDEDWSRLTDFIIGESLAGRKKNSELFSIPLGGTRPNHYQSFQFLGKYGYFWSSTFKGEIRGAILAWCRAMGDSPKDANRYCSETGEGLSVRCLKE